MGKFGKKNEVSLNPLDYNITILGISGVGKTTMAKEASEKLVGEDGYIHFDIGREAGAKAIQGIVSEEIEDWAKLEEVVDDITENKTSDYPNLKVVIWDTLDELVVLAEEEAIRLWNKNPENKRAETINGAWGGFGKGQDKALDLILDMYYRLRKVGVSSITIGHVKRTDIQDPLTNETYSKLTADTTQRYFNGIKNKQHFVAVIYIDREIVKEKTGRKNLVTKQDITINKAVSESRVISFRDDTYSVDSKSRFADIIDKVPFNVDDFIGAMTDAIKKEKLKSGKTLTEAEKEQKEAEKKKEAAAAKNSELAKEENARRRYIEEIQEKYSDADREVKTNIKSMLKETGCAKFTDPDLPIETLKQMAEML